MHQDNFHLGRESFESHGRNPAHLPPGITLDTFVRFIVCTNSSTQAQLSRGAATMICPTGLGLLENPEGVNENGDAGQLEELLWGRISPCGYRFRRLV